VLAVLAEHVLVVVKQVKRHVTHSVVFSMQGLLADLVNMACIAQELLVLDWVIEHNHSQIISLQGQPAHPAF